MMKLKFGTGLPSHVRRDGSAVGPSKLAEYSKEAERLGFGSLWIFDQLLKAEPRHLTTWMEPLVVAGAVAQATNKIELATFVALPRREPVLLAKTLASLDVLSSGRLVLVAGVGSEEHEFRAQGISMRRRGKKTDEMLTLMKRLWKETDVTFEGEFFRVEKINLQPKPTRGYIPTIIGGGTHADAQGMKSRVKSWNPDAVFRRIARFGDGFITLPSAIVRSTEPVERDWSIIRKYTIEAGREPERLERAHLTFYYVGRSSDPTFPETARKELSNFTADYEKNFLVGTVEELALRIVDWIRAGINHPVLAPISEDIEQLEILGKEVIPKIKGLLS